jgi:hypothetical protein
MSNTHQPLDGQTPINNSGAYKEPVEALKGVGEAFNAWSGSLTSTSLQLCYALVGANWVVFGSIKEILKSEWAKLSLLSILIVIAANVVVALLMTELHRRQYRYAEEEVDRWKAEFEKYASTSHPWPFTRTIEVVGAVSRWVKAIFPLIGALLLGIGACNK